MAEQKTKEIAIRKVLGAKPVGIMANFSKEFIMLVTLANIFAWPVAYYYMDGWLSDFAYRIDINLWTFVISGALAMIIAFLTVSFQTIKAALTNPIKSLRYE